MLGQKFLGMIASVTAAVKKDVTPEGEFVLQEIVKFKLESSSIDYDNLKEFYPEMVAMLTNIEPNPCTEMKFANQYANIKFSFLPEGEQDENFFNDGLESVYGKVTIDGITVKIKESIPLYVFEMSYPVGYGSIKDLFKNLKQKISFEIDEWINTNIFSDKVEKLKELGVKEVQMGIL